ncbi:MULTISPECIES: TetR/AcrR family transcriptional regulator [unclassified Streptomyces]|uniref:TetR/AcrR family transcriptional regulator n=1 Tax=unclassified Streptomyces TaxID=2593676 RepID=UPI00088958F2|nr:MULTISPECIES: TetR/AcrR family transcriptional regulator [unclassified Streptomyces]PBC81557.1 TetR family transcriptional regulator [Streptomyces sp. 2321.6]SDR54314.1 transcriptional regulator, TetR family [Streptomyces sp. KS_16]SEC20327.1 transcriptional regulator, TetR family [Streptomyces sp. 2133.1]SEF06915.1 transcriptional regulator, TetR family [Streptomyces sp. 2112.3]SNC65818.1 DNA-binding transcriptional regulator, AcrR family [Streptomyces sp. 2114.4]
MQQPTPRPGPPPASLRRAPVQQRSAQRLARILDACAEVLDETGYDELSTRAVAGRAGVPIGSVYRFFPNKRAMAKALARRNLDAYADRITARLTAPAGRPLQWRHAMDVVVDEYLAMKRTMPGFALVEFTVPAPHASRQANDEVADRLRALLAGPLGLDTADERLRTAFLVAVETADALLQLAFRTDPAGDPAIVTETKELLRAYLARYLDAAVSGDGETAEGKTVEV